MTTTALKEPVRETSPGAARGPRRRTGRIRRLSLPYLLLLPALLLELLVHLVALAIGGVMSFKELTQFYIRDRGTAPGSGLEHNRG
ncbi:sugar ABC transporter permease, partial [Streptomyces tricolor]